MMSSFPLALLYSGGEFLTTDTCARPSSCLPLKRLSSILLFISTAWAACPSLMTWFAANGQTRMAPNNASACTGATVGQIQSIPLINVPRGRECCCAVCLMDIGSGGRAKQLPCGHVYHACCIDAWLVRNKRCPLCRQALHEKAQHIQIRRIPQSTCTS